jgi:hypothetical protein
MSDSFVILFWALNAPEAATVIGRVILVTLFAPTLFIFFSFFPLLKEREKVSLLSLRLNPLQVGGEKKCHFAITKVSPFSNFIFHFDE